MGFRGGGGGGVDLGQVMPFSKVVKRLVIACVAIWFLGIVIVEQYFLKEPKITLWFGLIPLSVVKDYFLWQPFTYLFIHATSPMPLIFNMLLLWWLGSELERHWGSRFFTIYFFVSGVGAGFLCAGFALIYSILTGKLDLLITPVLGASPAIFGLLVAYGIVFGERVVYFMFFFPMRAKYFVAILGAIEIVLVLNNGGIQGKVANLAHVGGLLSGYVFLKIWPYIKGGRKGSRASKLKLVVNNPEIVENDKPKYWN